MADLVHSLTTELRITGRIFRETALGLRRTGWMNLIIITTMTFILSLFGILMGIVIELKAQVYNIGSELEISAYVKDTEDTAETRDKLKALPNVKKITVIPKERAWMDMQKDYPLPDIENPLPDTIHLQMRDVKYIPETVERIKSYPEIAAVNYAKKVLDKINGITKGTSVVGIVVSFFLSVLTLFIISNTIHLLIQAKSREIEILRMMGVGNWYIRLPFLIQGAVYGLVGALISYIPLSVANYYITLFFNYIGLQASEMTTNYVMMLLILMGIVVGAGGATVAIRKYLQV